MASDQSDIHADLARAADDHARRSGGLARVRALRDTEAGFDRAGWPQLGDLGWLGMLLPERLGGAGLGLAEMAVVARRVGHTLFPAPLTAAAVLAGRILPAGPTARGDALAGRLASGRLLPAVAWQETNGNIDAGEIATRAESTATGLRVNGVKRFVIAGLTAEGYIVSARYLEGVALCWVAAQTCGVSYRSERRADGTEHGVLELREVDVAETDMLVPPERGSDVLAAAIDHATIIASAELLGAAERALELTLDYLRTRAQFGRPIGSFQALQHRAVDMFIQKELCVSALAAALDGAERSDPRRRAILAARVKARTSGAAVEICRKCIQLHGAMGFTDECDIGLYLKRALSLSAWLGNAPAQRRRYAALKLAGSDATPSRHAA